MGLLGACDIQTNIQILVPSAKEESFVFLFKPL